MLNKNKRPHIKEDNDANNVKLAHNYGLILWPRNLTNIFKKHIINNKLNN